VFRQTLVVENMQVLYVGLEAVRNGVLLTSPELYTITAVGASTSLSTNLGAYSSDSWGLFFPYPLISMRYQKMVKSPADALGLYNYESPQNDHIYIVIQINIPTTERSSTRKTSKIGT
jgi:hypothetical protein